MLILSLLLISKQISISKQLFYLINNQNRIVIPSYIYKLEQKADLFEITEVPKSNFIVVPFDLNSDKRVEFFVSNINNNGTYARFWRIYEPVKKKFKFLGEMFCTEVKANGQFSSGYMDIDCYNYISLVEGNVKYYRYYADEYILKGSKKVFSTEFYSNY